MEILKNIFINDRHLQFDEYMFTVFETWKILLTIDKKFFCQKNFVYLKYIVEETLAYPENKTKQN